MSEKEREIKNKSSKIKETHKQPKKALENQKFEAKSAHKNQMSYVLVSSHI